jgi:hypothetical protein
MIGPDLKPVGDRISVNVQSAAVQGSSASDQAALPLRLIKALGRDFEPTNSMMAQVSASPAAPPTKTASARGATDAVLLGAMPGGGPAGFIKSQIRAAFQRIQWVYGKASTFAGRRILIEPPPPCVPIGRGFFVIGLIQLRPAPRPDTARY